MAGIAATVTTYLASPDSHERTRITIRAMPGEDVAIGSLDDGEDVTGTLVGHGE